ncbi:MAG TPA: alpha/beta fold hydrolase [Symbiobacteriaceae bacterium]|nr:alpha/beta fold hydrolase [Symbiobacteriaceae bacterium]
MPFAAIAGTRLYYEETGPSAGRPLLLLHASLQTCESMAPLRARLAPLGYRMVTPDQRGHGRTGNPGRTLGIAQLADDMEALIGHLGLERPIVAGFSLGGTVGIELARRGRLAGLVVLASRIFTVSRGQRALDPADIRRRSPLWVRQLEERHVETPWEELSIELGTMFETWPGFSVEELSGITCPTLVVQGDNDQMVPVDQGEALAAAVGGAKFHLVPRAGHPDLLYRRETVETVHSFLA